MLSLSFLLLLAIPPTSRTLKCTHDSPHFVPVISMTWLILSLFFLHILGHTIYQQDTQINTWLASFCPCPCYTRQSNVQYPWLDSFCPCLSVTYVNGGYTVSTSSKTLKYTVHMTSPFFLSSACNFILDQHQPIYVYNILFELNWVKLQFGHFGNCEKSKL